MVLKDSVLGISSSDISIDGMNCSYALLKFNASGRDGAIESGTFGTD
jgi:hypothetical protein